VVIGADACQVVELGLACSGDVEGSAVVHFDVALAQIPVGAGEAEAAHLAPERASAPPHLVDLLSAELRIPLASECPADEEASLDGAGAGLVDFVRLQRDDMQLTRADTAFDRLGGLEHLSLTLGEGIDHEELGLATSGGLAGVEPAVGHEVGGLAADAVRRPEAGQGEYFRPVDRQRAEQLRQFMYLWGAGPQLTLAVLHYERSGEQQFVLGSRRYPHEPYRMSVRGGGGCVQRTAERAAHLVTSRCQWGLSPSVMVDCKMCLPLHSCKEGA
jgi:hypothetical protein